jgi:hypothetical protein
MLTCWPTYTTGAYVGAFRENFIDGETLRDLTDSDLANHFGMINKFHRRALLKMIKTGAPQED